ncbi:hypothetical protein SAMN05444320_11540 [Streptoalloteichus hindustanus]|uniref:Uncharacterized protein n=1 Tax=Streptoalloteichus hindustanus TaxID=2017 RepID=A0A1M5NA69_STRHI|nr:hypothetical protein SAMN05444320_11540 [Streptoalloteichus hindustanus]
MRYHCRRGGPREARGKHVAVDLRTGTCGSSIPARGNSRRRTQGPARGAQSLHGFRGTSGACVVPAHAEVRRPPTRSYLGPSRGRRADPPRRAGKTENLRLLSQPSATHRCAGDHDAAGRYQREIRLIPPRGTPRVHLVPSCRPGTHHRYVETFTSCYLSVPATSTHPACEPSWFAPRSTPAGPRPAYAGAHQADHAPRDRHGLSPCVGESRRSARRSPANRLAHPQLGAGITHVRERAHPRSTAHPRVRENHSDRVMISASASDSSPHAEHARSEEISTSRRDSSPRARGAPPPRCRRVHVEGLIPACAGSTWMLNERRRASWTHPRVRGEHPSRAGPT